MAKGIINPMELKKHSKLEEGRFNLASKNKLANDFLFTIELILMIQWKLDKWKFGKQLILSLKQHFLLNFKKSSDYCMPYPNKVESLKVMKIFKLDNNLHLK